MARFSFLLLALSAIHPALTLNTLEDGQSDGFQLESFSRGSVSENPGHAVRLRLRQNSQCVDPGYFLCPDKQGCCPPSRFCCPTDCCPKGTRCCPGGGCAYPGGECCGGGWSCPAGKTCVPGTQSLCYTKTSTTSSCESETTTVTRTTTETSKLGKVTTRTMTQEPEEDDELPEFSCPPMTVTNDVGDTLEMGDDCALEYTQATSTSNANAALNGAAAQPRAAPCAAETTRTVTETTTTASRYLATVTKTRVYAETPTSDFSCPPMSVTNSFGDELSMDEECVMEFSPGSPTTDSGGANPTAAKPEDGPNAGTNNRGSYSMILSLATLAVALSW